MWIRGHRDADSSQFQKGAVLIPAPGAGDVEEQLAVLNPNVEPNVPAAHGHGLAGIPALRDPDDIVLVELIPGHRHGNLSVPSDFPILPHVTARRRVRCRKFACVEPPLQPQLVLKCSISSEESCTSRQPGSSWSKTRAGKGPAEAAVIFLLGEWLSNIVTPLIEKHRF